MNKTQFRLLKNQNSKQTNLNDEFDYFLYHADEKSIETIINKFNSR